MASSRPIRLAPSRALKERRLAELLQARDEREPRLREVLENALVVGSLELAGLNVTAAEVSAARRGEDAPAAVCGLLAAMHAVPAGAPLSVRALGQWHAAAIGGTGVLRRTERRRESGPQPAPVAFVESRLEILAQWLGVESSGELSPVQLGALALARIVEIVPFEEGNGRVSRLAASHLMVGAGARPPLLQGRDAPRLREAIGAAFQLHTEPLAALLDEAAGRSLDLLIATLAPEPDGVD